MVAYNEGIGRRGSPPKRDDDREGHYVYNLGENLTPRCELFRESFAYLSLLMCLSRLMLWICSKILTWLLIWQIKYLRRWVKVRCQVSCCLQDFIFFSFCLSHSAYC